MRRLTLIALVVAAASCSVGACGGDTTVEGQGGAGGTASGTLPAGGGGSGGSTLCADLESDYADALSRARFCAPPIATPQCTQLVATELDCPCAEVFVNPDNADAIADLDSIRQSFASSGCGSDACPAIECEPPMTGTCEPDGMDAGSGDCLSM